jgi:ligand-binding sensor domain-containing protein/signal transduction histidine kinase
VCLLAAFSAAAQPSPAPAANRVLEMDGTGGYVELPPNIFNDLEDATVEAWVRWDDFSGEYKRLFNYGDARRDFSITSRDASPSLWFVVGDDQRELHEVVVPNLLRTQQWCHVAAVSGKGGMKLYLNGALAGTNEYTGSFAGLNSGDRFYLGQRVTTNDPPTNFKGAMDEVRVWKVARTGAQIRETMFRRLTGKEPGLSALWNFENVENGVVKDAGPGAHHGKLIGNAKVLAEDTPASLAPARVSNVLQLDGRDSFVELPANAFTNLDEVTVEGWVKWESFGSMSRFFDFTLAGYALNVQNRNTNSTLHVESFRGDDLTTVQIPDMLSLGRWTHIAAAAGTHGVTLFVNGALVATNATPGRFSATGLGRRNYLGRSNFKSAFTTDADFRGQMGEVRVWKGARTEAQIRENMFKDLTGKEEGLAGLWNFEDGSARDASPAAHHGDLIGQAKVVEATLPSPTTLAPWSRLLLQITDATGAPLQNVTVRAEADGAEVGRATSNGAGSCPVTVWTSAPAVDLLATATNDLGGWQFAVPITRYAERTTLWALGPAIHLAGRAVALDGKTPHAALVVELVKPDDSPDRQPSADHSADARIFDARSIALPRTDAGAGTPAATNHVLQLDGTSSAEFPPNIFNQLTEATIEGWIKWDRLEPTAALFDFGRLASGEMWAEPANDAAPDLTVGIFSRGGTNLVYNIRAREALHTNEWLHIAFVTGPGGMRLFLNGILAGTNAYAGSFASLDNNNRNRIGRWLTLDSNDSNDKSLSGQIDEFRVWKTQRTTEQIRENMQRKLAGNEPDLVGLWNFDDPSQPLRDASPGAHHGSFIGQGAIASAELPAIVCGTIADAAGKPLADASVDVHQSGQPGRRIHANAAGEYAITLASAGPCDLFVTTGKLSAYRLGFQPSGEARQRLDWTLAETQGALAAARDAPIPPRRAGDSPSSPASATANRVLRLAGTNSFVELPSKLLEGAVELTIEAWVKWEKYGEWSPVFDFGASDGTNYGVFGGTRDNAVVTAFLNRGRGVDNTGIFRQELIWRGQWHHVASVLSTNGMRLYLDGRLLGTNAYTGRFFTSGPVKQFFLGRFLVEGIDPLQGEMDEVRVWNAIRTQEQIRENLGRKLTGSEPGLIGLWNFDDPANPAHDASPGGHHGKLMGEAASVPAELPVVVYGAISDAGGKSLAGAIVEVRQPTGETRRLAANDAGEYALTMGPADRLDLFVTTGELSAYRLGFRPNGEKLQKLDWTLADTQSGRLGVPASAGSASAVPQITDTTHAGPAKAGTPNLSQLPAGVVVARVLTDPNGNFDFPNLKPGAYQLRAQVLGGTTWCDGGKIFFTRSDMPEAEFGKLKGLDFRLAPFKKGLWTTYDSSHGLPSNEIRKFWYDTEDGSLWIATMGGVSRFDGKEFVNLTTEDGLLDDVVFNLWREPGGIWWFCTARGVSRYDPAAARAGRLAFHNYTSQDGLVAGQIHAVAQTPDGHMWFGSFTGSGVSRFDGERFTNFSPQGAFENIITMAAGQNGVLWLGTLQGLVRLDGTNMVNVTRQLGVRTTADSPAIDPDGSVWFGGDGLVRFDPAPEKTGRKTLEAVTSKEGLISDGVRSTYRAEGNVWIATGRGVSLSDGKTFVNFTTADGLAGNDVITVTGTPDGVMWFGTRTAGISRCDPHHFARFDVADGLMAPNSPDSFQTGSGGASLAAQDGALWFASGFADASRGLVRFDGRGFERILPRGSNAVTSLALAKDESIWVGVSGEGIARYAQGRFEKLAKADGLIDNDVTSLAVGQGGELWVGTWSAGLSRYDGRSFQNFTTESGLPTNGVLSVAVDAKSQAWIGTRGGGLLRYDGNRFEQYTTTNGLASDVILKILPTSDGVVWVGTDNGLSKLADGKLATYRRTKDRLVNNAVTGLLQDAEGVLWISTPGGVTRYDGNAWSTLTSLDGLQTSLVWTTVQDGEGAFWFSTDKGLVRYRPDRTPPRSPSVTVLGDKESTQRDATAEITAGRRTLFKWNVVDLKTRGDTRRFRWQVAEGKPSIDAARHARGWLPASRETQLEWQTNRAGTYTLAVQYIDRDLNYSAPTVLTLKVTPVWYANAWIVLPGGGAALALIGWAFVARWLYARKRREAQRLREQLFEEEQRARRTLESKNIELAAAKDAAEAASRTKSTFLANMSHELRTPLTAIIGFSEMLLSEARAEEKKEQAEDLERINDSAIHLLGLINDILDLSKVEAQKMELNLETFDISSLVIEVRDTIKPLVAKKSNALVVDCPEDIGSMRADATKVRQALLNLLSNANKFTDQGTITLRVWKSEGQRLNLKPGSGADGARSAHDPRSSGRESAHSSLERLEPTHVVQRVLGPPSPRPSPPGEGGVGRPTSGEVCPQDSSPSTAHPLP